MGSGIDEGGLREPSDQSAREDGASVLTPDTEWPVLSWGSLGCGQGERPSFGPWLQGGGHQEPPAEATQRQGQGEESTAQGRGGAEEARPRETTGQSKPHGSRPRRTPRGHSETRRGIL